MRVRLVRRRDASVDPEQMLHVMPELVSAHQTLLRRARTCMRIRDRLPNLIAVDFYRRGDMLGVVDDLNRLSHE